MSHHHHQYHHLINQPRVLALVLALVLMKMAVSSAVHCALQCYHLIKGEGAIMKTHRMTSMEMLLVLLLLLLPIYCPVVNTVGLLLVSKKEASAAAAANQRLPRQSRFIANLASSSESSRQCGCSTLPDNTLSSIAQVGHQHHLSCIPLSLVLDSHWLNRRTGQHCI